jgi:kynureninase
MKPGLEITRQFDMKDIRAKSMGLTGLFLQLVESFCDEHDVGIFSPHDASQRGSQISLTHEHGYKIVQAMIERGVIGDFRMPNIMRFGFAPLYISYQDTFNAAMILKDVLESGVWQEPRFAQKSAVT